MTKATPGSPEFREDDTEIGRSVLNSPDAEATALLKTIPLDQLERLLVRAHAVSNRLFLENGQAMGQQLMQTLMSGGLPRQDYYAIPKPESSQRADRLVALLEAEKHRRTQTAD